MIYVGIDVSKDKHDCYIVNSDGKVLADVFTVENNLEGFDLLFQRLKSVARDLDRCESSDSEKTSRPLQLQHPRFSPGQRSGHLMSLNPPPHQPVSQIYQSSQNENGSCGCAHHCSYDDVRCQSLSPTRLYHTTMRSQSHYPDTDLTRFASVLSWNGFRFQTCHHPVPRNWKTSSLRSI